jgi:hypothetical protein
LTAPKIFILPKACPVPLDREIESNLQMISSWFNTTT